MTSEIIFTACVCLALLIGIACMVLYGDEIGTRTDQEC